MTEVWTSEPPTVGGYYHYKRADDGPFVLWIMPNSDGVTRELFRTGEWDWKQAIKSQGAQRSIDPIPSAERLAAMRRVCDVARDTEHKFECGALLSKPKPCDCELAELSAALAALEEVERG